MAKSAKEIVAQIQLNRKAQEEKGRQSFRDKCVAAVNDMIGLGEFSTEVELEDGDVIDTATEEMRELGYKFCLIEVQDEKGEIKSQRLRISVQHLA